MALFKAKRGPNHAEPLLSEDSTVLNVDEGSDQSDSTASVYIRPKRNSTTRVFFNQRTGLIVANSDAHVVFPTGIFYKRICNNNSFPVQLVFQVGTQTYKVCIGANSVCHDITVAPSPSVDEPRGQRWCERFGVITKQLLDKGVVETREDGSFVVWKTFRHSPSKLTPFGIWCDDPGNCQFTVFTADEYNQLCAACLSYSVDSVWVSASPLFARDATLADNLYVSLDARFPFLLQASPLVADSPV